MRGTLRTAGVWCGCIAPTAALNQLPHFQALLAGTPAGVLPHIVMLVVKAAFVVGVAYLPLQAEKAENRKHALACWVLWLGLCSVCFVNALDGAGLLRDSLLKPVRELKAQTTATDSRIAELTNSRTQLPHFIPATPAMVEAARTAALDARTARDQECGKVGKNCRQRVGEMEEANKALVAIEGRRALTEKAERIEAKLSDLRDKRAVYVPDHADQAAARLALILGTDEAVVADWWPTWLALIIEAWAALGAYCFLPRQKSAAVAAPVPAEVSETPAPKTAGLRKTPATPAKRKKAKPDNGKEGAGLGDVRDWFDSRTSQRADSRVKPGEAYSAYKDWCAETGHMHVTLTAFGLMMKGELGVVYEEKNKRGHYVGIALTSRPKLAAVK